MDGPDPSTADRTRSEGGSHASGRLKVLARQGLHARPAARVVEAARRFEASVTLVHGDTRASAKDLLDVLYLAAPFGADLEVRAEGPDAERAVLALVALFESFGRES